MNDEKLRVLLVEDSPDDADLIVNALTEGGFTVDGRRVETAEAMSEALSRPWDIVLCDYSLPSFSAGEALALFRDRGLDIPFIVVSGRVGEEAAVTLLKQGAHDLVLKGSPRLVPAVRRELLEAKMRRDLAAAQLALQKSEARFRAIASNLPGMVFQWVLEKDGAVYCPYASDGAFALFGLSPQTLQNRPQRLMELVQPEDAASFRRSMMASAETLTPWSWEGRIGNRNGDAVRWIDLRASPRRTNSQAVIWDGIMIDITRSKLVEIELVRSRQQLAAFSSHLERAKEAERARIAREIHDDIGGTLTAIKCDLLWCHSTTPRDPRLCKERATSVELLVDHVIESTRRISRDLRPAILDCGIVAAVRWQLEEFRKRVPVFCEIEAPEQDIPLEADRAVSVFRIFQEVLTNIAKHAAASRVRVRLGQEGEWLRLEVTDNGRGISDEDFSKPESFGICSIRERCRDLKGSVEITAAAGGGTRVAIRVPLELPAETGSCDSV
jgi:PAS domain S-box-containing protein